MSIPTPFNPMGTLGENRLAGYVTDGLILCFDALLEEPGTRNYLTNWASGTRCEFDNPVRATGAYITGASSVRTKFNQGLSQQIDGHSPVGMDYSADICAQQGCYIDFMVWSMDLGFQWHQGSEGIRVRGALSAAELRPIISYPLQKGEKNSAHVDFDEHSSLRIKGENVGSIINDSAGVGQVTVGLGTSAATAPADTVVLFAYRLYNRRLTIAEQKQNYAADKKRFGL